MRIKVTKREKPTTPARADDASPLDRASPLDHASPLDRASPLDHASPRGRRQPARAAPAREGHASPRGPRQPAGRGRDGRRPWAGRAGDAGGSGLGREIVIRHGGCLRVEGSETGAGVVARLLTPRQR
ncbi:hypothetical protein [Allokutzneria oryzae]|uniref:Uncharacterized protein n=1 Tax=Allokutzneria oryzae TaxID=1378989 RepID=A0ABV6A3M0_9PSEU